AYDIVLHNYGPTSVIASAHMEVDGDMTALEIHRLSRVITADVYQKLGIVLTLGIYASRPEDPFISDVQKTISDLAGSEKDVLQVHGIFVDPEAKAITFDIVVDFRGNGQEIRSRVRDRLLEKYPGYSVSIVLDSDYGES
ncbi:MAG: cation transporter, partial [Clostridia bacterium]|nr:cation transporter [Clostridia bacterium]